MGMTRSWIAVAAAIAASTANPAWAQDEVFKHYVQYVAMDGQRPGATMRLIGNARYVEENGIGRVRLTDGFNQVSGFFIPLSQPISDYEFRFTFEARRVSPGEEIGDGFMFVAKTGDVNRIGNGGGALGYAKADSLVLPSDEAGGGIFGYSYGVEFNSYWPQGLTGAAETAGIDVLGLRTRISQTPFRFVERGRMTVAIRVTPGGLTVQLLTDAGRQTILQSPRWMGGFFEQPQPLSLGFTAATGGARQIVDIYGISIGSKQPLQ